MFNFSKKNAEIEEQVMEEVTDEQLSQVTGGSMLNSVNVGGLLHQANIGGLLGNTSGITCLASQEMSSIGVSGLNLGASGISLSVPALAPATLLP